MKRSYSRITASLLSLVLVFFVTASVFAQPAPWYKWKSKVNGKVVCAQTTPGDGWVKDSGPYRDARCEKPAPRAADSSVIRRPSAEQVMQFSDAVARTPAADRKVAAEALQKWMDGKLTTKEAEQYKAKLALPQREPSTAAKPMGNSVECAACIAGCCAWWGCNPACIAGCVAGICK